jgi:hypothetical protein
VLYLTIASLVVAVIAVAVAVKQTNIARAVQRRQEDDQREIRDWQLKHEAVAVQLAKIHLTFMVPARGGGFMALYPAVFPEPELRNRIETYIVEIVDNRTRFAARTPTAHELHSPTLRRTVDDATAILERFKGDNPELAQFFR